MPQSRHNLAAPVCSVWCAAAACFWLYGTAVRRSSDRAKVVRQRRNIEGLDFSSSGSAMRHIWPRGTQNSPRTPAYAHRGASEGIQTKWWSNDAIFARGASRRETRAPHRPTSHGPLLHHFVSDRRRPHNKRYPTLRWPDRLETAPKKTIVGHFAWFLAVFSARRAAFAAAFFAMRRPTAGAQPGLPLGARPCSAMLFVKF